MTFLGTEVDDRIDAIVLAGDKTGSKNFAGKNKMLLEVARTFPIQIFPAPTAGSMIMTSASSRYDLKMAKRFIRLSRYPTMKRLLCGERKKWSSGMIMC